MFASLWKSLVEKSGQVRPIVDREEVAGLGSPFCGIEYREALMLASLLAMLCSKMSHVYLQPT
jgi:hypothetical protein